MLAIISISLLLGLVSGGLAGLFGLGGGLIIVPVLMSLFSAKNIMPEEQQMIFAIATSLATIILTALSSTIMHQRQKTILWFKVKRFVPGIFLGAILGTIIADKINNNYLHLFFVFYLVYSAIKMAFQLKVPNIRTEKKIALDYIAGIIIGVLSSILGIGGGSLTVPYLTSTKIPIKNAVAISSACGFPIACSATASYIFLGLKQPNLPEWSLGYVYLPAFFGIICCSILTAPLGAKLALKLPAKKLKRYFSIILLMIALKVAWAF
jgi:uncharacterized membrane protein YfcA